MSADVFAEGEPNRTEQRPFVVKAEPCGWALAEEADCQADPCAGCLGDGSRLDVSSAIPVEPSHLYDYERRFVACFVPVSSTEENPT